MTPRDNDDQFTGDESSFDANAQSETQGDVGAISPFPARDEEIEDPDYLPSEDLVEHEPADPEYVAAEVAHERKIRWVVLAVIAGLIAFSMGATLLATLLSSDDTEAQIAGDIAKLSIPTLLTLLGAAVAWAYRRNNND